MAPNSPTDFLPCLEPLQSQNARPLFKDDLLNAPGVRDVVKDDLPCRPRGLHNQVAELQQPTQQPALDHLDVLDGPQGRRGEALPGQQGPHTLPVENPPVGDDVNVVRPVQPVVTDTQQGDHRTCYQKRACNPQGNTGFPDHQEENAQKEEQQQEVRREENPGPPGRTSGGGAL